MKTPVAILAYRYRIAHNEMRSINGLQPSEALDELLKYLLFKTEDELSLAPIGRIDVFSPADFIASTVHSIRNKFAEYLTHYGEYAAELFYSADFRLSDSCLAKVHEVLCNERITKLSFDIRSAALRAFLTPDLRKGLGIFLTPDEVVSEIIEFFDFSSNVSVADPACGSGTFLLAAAKKALSNNSKIHLIGIDKSPRMMLLADLNMGTPPDIMFSKKVCDTLRPREYAGFLPDNSVDCILTNPPFGVSVDRRSYDLSQFVTAYDDAGKTPRRQSSELLFLERCLVVPA